MLMINVFFFLAIVEFNEPYEARNAFTKLAYSKFKQSPLYLEWAPAETFTTECSKDKSINNNTDKGNSSIILFLKTNFSFF